MASLIKTAIKGTAIESPGADPAGHQTILRQLKEVAEIGQRLRGDPADSFVRVSELVQLGLARLVNGTIQPYASNLITTPVTSSRRIITPMSVVGGGDLSADRTLTLENDSASPGADKIYRTDHSNIRGWGQLTSGMFPNLVVPDAALSANVPLLNAANTFTADQTISKTTARLVLSSLGAQFAASLFSTNGVNRGYMGADGGTTSIGGPSATAADLGIRVESGKLCVSLDGSTSTHHVLASTAATTTFNGIAVSDFARLSQYNLFLQNVVGPFGATLVNLSANAVAYTTLRLYNDQNTANRALEIDYTSSAYGTLITGGPSGEQAAIGTTGAKPLTLYTNNTAALVIDSSRNFDFKSGNATFGCTLANFSINGVAASDFARLSQANTFSAASIVQTVQTTGTNPAGFQLNTSSTARATIYAIGANDQLITGSLTADLALYVSTGRMIFGASSGSAPLFVMSNTGNFDFKSGNATFGCSLANFSINGVAASDFARLSQSNVFSETVVGPAIQTLVNLSANAAAYTSLRLYNDQNTGVRALEIDYSSSTYGTLITGGPSGEQGAVGTTGAYPLTLYTGNNAALVIDSSRNFDFKTGHAKFGAPVQLKNYTVGTLPAGTRGDVAYVTDALAPTFLTAVAGGGAVVSPVFYDGTNWVTF